MRLEAFPSSLTIPSSKRWLVELRNLDHEEFRGGPVGRQLWIEFRERPLHGRNVARESGLLRRGLGAGTPEQQRERNDSRQAQRNH